MAATTVRLVEASFLNKPIRWKSLSVFLVYTLLGAAGLSWAFSATPAAIACVFSVLFIALFSSSDVCCKLLCVCFPFFNIMGVQLGGTSSYYILIFLYAVKSLRDGSVASIGSRFAAYAAIIAVTVYNFSAGPVYVKWLIHLLVPFLLLGTPRFRETFPVYVRYLSFSTVLSCFIALLMQDTGVYLYTFGSVRTGTEVAARFAGLVGDAVVCGQILVVLIAVNMYLAYIRQSYKGSAVLCAVMAFFVFLTYSKSGLACLCLLAVFGAIVFARRIAEKRILVRHLVFGLFGLFFLGVGAVYLLFGSSFSFEALVTRLTSSDLLTARREIWDAYFALWDDTGLSMLVKGIGFDTYLETTIYGRWNNCHSIYIEAVTLFGYAGALAVLAALAVFFVRCRRRGAPLVAYVPCFVLLATGFILHGFLDYPFFYEWLIALGCVDHASCGRNRVTAMDCKDDIES